MMTGSARRNDLPNGQNDLETSGINADRPADHQPRHAFRRTIFVMECVVAVSGLIGTLQLLIGSAVLRWAGQNVQPPVAVLEPLGLTSWRLPALWLFAMVAVPSAAAAWFVWRRSPHAPTIVLLAAATLVVELVVQIPFLGLSALQAVFGAMAIVLAALALWAHHLGWNAASAEPPTRQR